MISFVLKNARSTPGIRAQSAPPRQPETIIADDDEERGAARAAEVEARRGGERRAEVELPLGADVEEAHPERRRRREAR